MIFGIDLYGSEALMVLILSLMVLIPLSMIPTFSLELTLVISAPKLITSYSNDWNSLSQMNLFTTKPQSEYMLLILFKNGPRVEIALFGCVL